MVWSMNNKNLEWSKRNLLGLTAWRTRTWNHEMKNLISTKKCCKISAAIRDVSLGERRRVQVHVRCSTCRTGRRPAQRKYATSWSTSSSCAGEYSELDLKILAGVFAWLGRRAFDFRSCLGCCCCCCCCCWCFHSFFLVCAYQDLLVHVDYEKNETERQIHHQF